jgi:hypothetical protein
MTRRKSKSPALTLDHVALVTPSLATSREDYEALGFQLTAESSHKGAVEPGGKVELWGSGNHCAMFRQGYYEILGVTDPSRYHDHFRALLDRCHGVCLIALGCESSERLYESYKKDIEGLKEPVQVGRDVPHGRSTKPATFRIVHLEESAFPEAELFFIEHETPNVLWQAKLQDHPNGVRALEGITVCSEEPEATAKRFTAATLQEAQVVDSRPRVELTEGYVEFASADDIYRRYRGAVLPAVPCVAVLTLSVASLEDTREFFVESDVTPHESEHSLWIRPERAGGVILEFVE